MMELPRFLFGRSLTFPKQIVQKRMGAQINEIVNMFIGISQFTNKLVKRSSFHIYAFQLRLSTRFKYFVSQNGSTMSHDELKAYLTSIYTENDAALAYEKVQSAQSHKENYPLFIFKYNVKEVFAG